jgi:serine/threonine protein kinase
MKWNSYISKKYRTNSRPFYEIIENFDSLGEIIFQERNVLRKIKHPALGSLAVKSFKKPHLINQIVYANFRKSKASRSYFHAEILISKGIDTPEPIVFFEEINKFRIKRSFYFSKYIEYDFTFRELIENKVMFADWDFILKEFVRFVFNIHENNILFKDLSPGNVLIKKDNEKKSYSFSLIDLNRMTFKPLSLDQRLQNFIRLSLTDEMIPIIAKEYANYINEDFNLIREQLHKKNKKFIQNKQIKNKIKKLLGKYV